MEFIMIFIVSFLLMILFMNIYKNSQSRIRTQLISTGCVVVALVIVYYDKFNSVTNTLLYLLSIILPFFICAFLILRNTNFFRKIKFEKAKDTKTVLPEKMPSNKVLRKRYIISIVLLVIALIALILFTIFQFDFVLLATSIIAFVFIGIYIFQVIKMNVFKNFEPIRKLVIVVKTNKTKVYSISNDDPVFNTTKYLDIIREKYYVLPLCKAFINNNGVNEVHNCYILKIDKFENFDFLKEDDYKFYENIEYDLTLKYYSVIINNQEFDIVRIK